MDILIIGGCLYALVLATVLRWFWAAKPDKVSKHPHVASMPDRDPK